MQGFIRQRGLKWYVYWYYIDPSDGKRKQHAKAFDYEEPARRTRGELPKNRREGDSAREYLNAHIGDVQHGAWRPDTAVTVQQLLHDHYLPARKSEGLRPSTLDQYQNVADAWIIPHLGKLAVRQLTASNVRKWQDKIAVSGGRGKSPLAPRSVQLAVTVLKASTAWAVSNGLLQRDPLTGYKRPRGAASSRVKQVWDVEQACQFLESVADDRMYAAWSLLVTYGPRRGEICGLRWPNVHLEEKYIDIVETRIVVDGHPQASKPKTEAGNRQIPLTSADVAMLKAHQTRQFKERMKIGLGRGEDGFVFATQLGEPVSPDWLSRRFVELATSVELDDGAKLPKLTVHGLRHTAASMMRSLDLSPEVIAAILGHSSTSVLFEVYRHLYPKETAVVGEVMGEALRRAVMTE